MRTVTWLEPFFDLIFVAAVAQVGEPLREGNSFEGIARFSMFALIWWASIGNSVFAAPFDTDDALQPVLTFVRMFAVAAMAAMRPQRSTAAIQPVCGIRNRARRGIAWRALVRSRLRARA